MSTQKDWLTVSEAVKYTNKGLSTIRRLIAQMSSQNKKKYLMEEKHRGKKRYLLSRKFLNLKYNIVASGDSSQQTENQIRTLENQIEKKDQQINRLLSTVEDLGERNKELHILLQTEQKRSIGLQDQLNQIAAPKKEEPAKTQSDQDKSQTTSEEGTEEDPPEQETKKEPPTKEVPANVGLFGKDISNTSALILIVITVSVLMVIGILTIGN